MTETKLAKNVPGQHRHLKKAATFPQGIAAAWCKILKTVVYFLYRVSVLKMYQRGHVRVNAVRTRIMARIIKNSPSNYPTPIK